MDPDEPDLEFLDELELPSGSNDHSPESASWDMGETSISLSETNEFTPPAPTTNAPPPPSDYAGPEPPNDKITLEDLRDPERCLDDPEKYSLCLLLEQLECATRTTELSQARAIDFVQKQLSFVNELKGKRPDLAKSNAKLELDVKSMGQHLRRLFSDQARQIDRVCKENPPPDANLWLRREHYRSNKFSAKMHRLLLLFAKQAALDHTKGEIVEQFDKHLKRKGLNCDEIKTMEEILQRPGVDQLYALWTKRGLFRPEDSLGRLHDLGRTVDVDQLLALLETNDNIPLMNILEWKHVTMQDLKKVQILPEDIDAARIDWTRVAAKMERCGHNFSPMEWHNIWCNHIKETKSIKAQKDIVDLVKIVGRDWKAISNHLSIGLSEEECKKMYYDQLCALSAARPSGQKHPTRLTKRQMLMKSCRFAPQIEKLLQLDIFNDSFTLLADVLNYIKPYLNIKPQELKRQDFVYWRFRRRQSLKYSQVEDALLLVTLTQVKSIIHIENNLSCLKYFLPWRPVAEWRLRLRSLARQWFNARFTVQENMKLIYIANVMPSRWVEISKYFDGYDRKACRGHYTVLQKHISRGETLLDYHAKHGPKHESTHYPYVKKMINFLFAFIMNDGKFKYKETDGSIVERRPPEFTGFMNRRLPTQEELRSLLSSINPAYVIQACKDLVNLTQKLSGPPRLPEVPLKRQRKTFVRRILTSAKKHKARAKRRRYSIRADLEDMNVNLDDFACCDATDAFVPSSRRLPGSSNVCLKLPFQQPAIIESDTHDIDSFRSAPAPCKRLRKPKPSKEKNVIPTLENLVLPKGKRKPGRKTGRLSQIRREVALSRWRKNNSTGFVEPEPLPKSQEQQENSTGFVEPELLQKSPEQQDNSTGFAEPEPLQKSQEQQPNSAGFVEPEPL